MKKVISGRWSEGMEIEGIEKRWRVIEVIERIDLTATSNRINAIEKKPSFLWR